MILQPKFPSLRAVIGKEAGDLVLSSILKREERRDRKRVIELPSDDPKKIPDLLLQALESAHDGSLVLISDAILAFEVYTRLKKEEGIFLEVVSQWREKEDKFVSREFVFAPGMMLREADRELAELLEASQRQLFRSDWRVESTFLEPLFDGVEGWLEKLRVGKDAIASWPDHAPLFLFPQDVLRQYLRGCFLHREQQDELIVNLCGWIEQWFKQSLRGDILRKLFKISPPLSREIGGQASSEPSRLEMKQRRGRMEV
jgi:hypothetical protein